MPEYRIGHGYDIHRLQEGGQLVLGGVVVAEGISPIAHSDGDVVIHALVDAILGALGQGDIGEHFPNSQDVWKNAPSRVFLETAMQIAAGEGAKVCNADITILAERPRLAAYKSEMAANLSASMEGAAVNIKAGTNEGCGEIGTGQAIAAHAVVLLASKT